MTHMTCRSIAARLPAVATAVALFAMLATLSACDRWMSPESRLERAQSHLQKGDYRAASSDLKIIIESEPNNGPARAALAEASLWLGDIESAEKEARRALQAGTKDASTYALLYEALLAGRKFAEVTKVLGEDVATPAPRRQVIAALVQAADPAAAREAEAALTAALNDAPDDPDALIQLARFTALRGDMSGALDHLDRITDSDRSKARAQLARGAVLMAGGEQQQARAALEGAHAAHRHLRAPEQLSLFVVLTQVNLALSDVEAARKSLAYLEARAANAPITHYLKAHIAFLGADTATTVSEAQRALAADPNHTQSKLLLATALSARGSFEQAETTLNQLIAAQPDNMTAKKLLAQVYLARREPERATSALAAVSSSGVDDPQLQWLMGSALMQSGNAEGMSHLERSVAAAPDDVTRTLQLASAYISMRQPDKAVPLLERVPQSSPLAPRARALLVLARVSGKQPAEAAAQIDQLIAADPKDANLLTAAGSYFATTGNERKGRELLERALSVSTNGVEPRLYLAMLDAATGNKDVSEKRLREILAIDAKNQPARLGLSELAWRNGDRVQAGKWLEEAISVDPSAVEARLRLAQLALLQGQTGRGRDLLNQAANVATDRGAALNTSGKMLARAGLTEEALTSFNQARTAGVPEATLNAARLMFDSDRRGEARAMLESALSNRPQWREAAVLLMQMDARDGQVDRALARANNMDTELKPAARTELEGDLHFMARRFEPATTQYESALAQAPSAVLAVKLFRARLASKASAPERSLTDWLQRTPADADVRRQLAAFYESSGRKPDAMAQYRRLLDDGKIDPASLNNYAWMLHEQGDKQALELARRAHQAAPDVPQIADTYGWILVQTGSIQEGLKVLERAVTEARGDGDMTYHLAVARHKLGQTEQAIETLTKLLKSDAKFQSRGEAQKLLETMSAARS